MDLKTWKQRARQLSAQTYTLYLAYRHPKTPWYAKVFAALIVGYVFSPIDPIPDFIPGVGLLDEMVVVPIGVWVATKLIPQEVFEECKEKARAVATGEKPVSRVAAVVVIAVWLLCVAAAVFLAAEVLDQMGRFSFAMFAATCTVMASLLLLDATGLMALEPLADRALQIASAGMMVGLAAWAVAVLVGRD